MRIYLDHAAATPLDKRVAAFISKAQSVFGNASALHIQGREAKKLLDDSRKKVAAILSATAPEIIFTASGTESVNLAILGIARAHKTQGRHIITSKIEHLSVLRACAYLERHESFAVTYLDVQANGIIDPETVRQALRADTILVSVMYANNEIGTIQPIAKISKTLRNFEKQTGKKVLFHSDACQAVGALDVNVQKLGVDLLSLNGSKIYGPKGTGCLFVRRGTMIEPMLVGGSQELGRRAGTENVPLLAGFALALELADKNRVKESARLTKLRDYLIVHLTKPMSRLNLDITLNGDPVQRLPNNVNLSFPNVDGEMLVLALDQKGIAVSTGSACTTSETGQLHVLKALRQGHSAELSRSPQGKPASANDGNLRITLGRSTTKKDLEYFLKTLTGALDKRTDRLKIMY